MSVEDRYRDKVSLKAQELKEGLVQRLSREDYLFLVGQHEGLMLSMALLTEAIKEELKS